MRLLVMEGDGIGPEIVPAALTALTAAKERFGLDIAWDTELAGFASLERYGTTLRTEVLEMAGDYDGIVLGPQSHMDYPPAAEGGVNISSAFRVGLDLYANVRPARTRDVLGHVAKPFDLVIVREATEGFYADRNMHAGTGEFMPTSEMALSIRKITSSACERIARRAFDLAIERQGRVTAVHKANCFHLTDGLFLKQVRKVALDYPDIDLDTQLVDSMAAMLVRDPGRFDVVVTTNFYGDILSDLASELAGGLGLAGAVNANQSQVCAQAQHGSAPDIAGRDTANPISMILSVAMLLDDIGRRRNEDAPRMAARALDAAVDAVLSNPETRPPDLGGSCGTQAFAEAVANHVAKAAGEPVR